MSWVTVLGSWMALIGSEPPTVRAPCSEAAIRAGGAAVAEARATLMMVPVGEMDPTVTPEAQRAIETLKDRLTDFVSLSVACAAAREPAEAVQQRLSALGHAAAPRETITPEEWRDMHGSWLTYEVATPPGRPDLLAVVARFGIECGADTLFFLFARREQARLLMIRRSPPYAEINGAYLGFTFAVSPRDRLGRWYVATAWTRPWCTSAWRGISYELSRPGPSPVEPRIFYRRAVSAYIGGEVLAELRARPNRFQIEHEGGIIDSDIIIRRHVETYRVDGEIVRRIQPVAFNVRDFVDAWIGADWAEASDWSARTPALVEAHRAIAALNHVDGIALNFGSIRRCAGGLTEVRIDVSSFAGRDDDLPPWYFYVRGNGRYRLERAARTTSTECRGPDLREAIERESLRRRGVPIS